MPVAVEAAPDDAALGQLEGRVLYQGGANFVVHVAVALQASGQRLQGGFGSRAEQRPQLRHERQAPGQGAEVAGVRAARDEFRGKALQVVQLVERLPDLAAEHGVPDKRLYRIEPGVDEGFLEQRVPQPCPEQPPPRRGAGRVEDAQEGSGLAPGGGVGGENLERR